jgi:Right handed beta helix region
MRIAIVAVIFVVGCGSGSGTGPGDDDPVECTDSSTGCVCLNNVCVECTVEDESNCSGTRPQCGADNVCRACRSNDECDSGACLEDGSCAAAAQIIYAAPGGANMAGCGMAAGRNECTLAQALLEVSAPRDIIRLAPGMYTVPSAAVDGLDFSTKSATLIARGATLTRGGANGTIVSVRNGQTLKIVGGTLQGPSNTTDGIKCLDNSKLAVHEVTIDDMTQSGIETNLCQLTVSRSTLRNNNLGGINMISASVATITNNFVYRNGGAASPFGGLGLKLAAGSKVELNTVADNIADANGPAAGMAAGGIVCQGQGYDAPGNLVYRNVGGLGGQVQVIGTCTFIGSYQQSAMPGENAVGFENPAGATPSYRLTAASPPGTIRDAFDCKDIDFEGDARPSPSADMGGKCDFGADEFREGK